MIITRTAARTIPPSTHRFLVNRYFLGVPTEVRAQPSGSVYTVRMIVPFLPLAEMPAIASELATDSKVLDASASRTSHDGCLISSPPHSRTPAIHTGLQHDTFVQCLPLASIPDCNPACDERLQKSHANHNPGEIVVGDNDSRPSASGEST